MTPKGNKVMVDVVVAGAGPAGSVAAKKCAERGLHTILLEKERLPRRKVCCGMLLSNLVHTLIANECGPMPEGLVTDPANISGYQWHTSRFGDEKQDIQGIINTWRKDLDHWMNQKAKEAGAEMWEEARVTSVIQQGDRINLKVRRGEQQQNIQARFVVGADGASSVTRKSLFPDFNVRLIGIYAECHPGMIDLDPSYFHVFGSPRTEPTRDWFDVTHKKDCFVIETNGGVRSPKEAMIRAKQTLAQKWGFDLKSEPLWTDGCTVPVLRSDLHSGKFLPAKGNVLLVGDAAGIATPSERGEGEGINMALKSAILASEAIIKAADTAQEAAPIYLTDMKRVIEVCKTIAADVVFYQTNWPERDKLLNTLI